MLEFLINHDGICKEWAEYFFKGYDELGVKQRNKAYILKSPLSFAVAYSLFPLLKLMFKRKDINTTSDIVLRDALRSFDLDTFSPRPQHPNVAVVKFLIENGADLEKTRNFRAFCMVPVTMGLRISSRQNSKKESILIFRVAAMKLHWPPPFGVDVGVVSFSTQMGSFFNIIKLFLEHGANANSQSKMVHSPLWLSCLYGDTDVIQLLLTYRANINGTGK